MSYFSLQKNLILYMYLFAIRVLVFVQVLKRFIPAPESVRKITNGNRLNAKAVYIIPIPKADSGTFN